MLKFRTEQRTRTVPHTVEGVTHRVTESFPVKTPVLPRDWDKAAIRAASTLVLALTAVAVVWSTVSIGSLLGGGVGYAAAVVFDVSWLVVLIVEWMARFNAKKREVPRTVGWLLVAGAAGAIFWHGMETGTVALAVVGAAVSVVSKVLWLVVMGFVHRDLSPADAQWVAAEMSKSNAKLAIAGVRRQAAAAEARARLELLAAERVLREVDELAEQLPSKPELVAEPVSGSPDTASGPVPLASTNPVRTAGVQMPSIAELAREQIKDGATNKDAAEEILRRIPNANAESVAATVRRERRGLQTNGTNGYL
ncbi:hypothetical protein [Streptomyces sp. NPDC020681]|uniref:hypothetical protein n=1 Tax=Streptomyces sp. NPDC020681 TaxID=3365083 RepID=UPI00378C8FD3